MNEKQIRNLGIATVLFTGAAYTYTKMLGLFGFGKNPSKLRQAIFIGSLVTLIGYKSCDSDIKDAKHAVVQIVDNKYKKERDAYKDSLSQMKNVLSNAGDSFGGLEEKLTLNSDQLSTYDITRFVSNTDVKNIEDYASFFLQKENEQIRVVAQRYIKGQAKYFLIGEFADINALYNSFPGLKVLGDTQKVSKPKKGVPYETGSTGFFGAIANFLIPDREDIRKLRYGY